jgi:hypothetical protein
VSTSRAVFDDERKEMFFFFFQSVDFEEFSKSRVAQKKRRRIKSSCARCFEAAKLFLIDELKLEQFFFLSVGVPDENYSQSSKLSSSSDIFTRR